MLLPDVRRRGEIHFVLLKSLPYGTRLPMIGALLVAGFVFQLYLSLFVGAAFLLAASLLGIVRGYTNVPRDMGGPREWRGGERNQLENVLTIARRSRQWDRSLLDVTSWMGLLALAAAAGLTGWVAYALLQSGYQWLAAACVLDVGVLLLPHWVTGVRRILTNDPLVVKIEQLLWVMDLWESSPHEGEVMLPQMQVRTAGRGEIPCDAKLVLRLEALGDEFLGLQVQVVLNNVQGSDYPYLYCVLVARPSLQMLDRLATDRPPFGIVCQPSHQEQDNVDIIVIRQETARTKGYHTPPEACAGIFTFALSQARDLLPAGVAGATPGPSTGTTA
jgi:hypothetical protein